MVLKLRHNNRIIARELFAAIRAECYLNLNSLDCLPHIFKIMVIFEIFLCRYPVQV